MDHGRYVGVIETYKGKTAIIRFETVAGHLLAQFDDIKLHTDAPAWFFFPISDFYIGNTHEA